MHIDKSFHSTNYDERESGIIDFIIIHHTRIPFKESVARLCSKEAKVSAHYIIKNDGKIFQLLEDDMRAWHAGQSYWRGISALNDRSIGIELDNNGNEPFATKQIESCINLCKLLKERYSIDRNNIIGHSDIAPTRKIDPGPYFPWDLLDRENLGIAIPSSTSTSHAIEPLSPLQIQTALSKIGYKVELTGILDEQTNFVIRAFILHFCAKNAPKEITKLQDPNTTFKLDRDASIILESLVE
ncbi:MAG: N-acetylmuramoyl-L-alanine amidase [Rickettsiaceae bacterium]|nr:N-acetylmuramoyl-L-alanine amidase [Rickettsiaceae bacterium]